MTGRQRKKDQQQPTGDAQETGEMLSDDRSLLEVFIASQSKRDEEATERALEARQEQLATEARAKQAQLDAEERAEQRRIRAEIAAEEREEKRREREEERKEKAKIAEEERLEARALEKEKRKREEAMRVEEANEKREEAAKESARQMLEMQAEFGRKASEAHRREVERAKVISSLTVIQKDEDLEDYLLTQERKLKGGGILEDEWLALVGTKLTGGLGTSWQDLVDEGLDYWGVRTALLKGKGYTPSQAGDDFYAFKHEHLKGMAGEQVFKKGAQLLKRMVAPTILEKSTIFKIVKPWVLGCVGRRARAALEAREIADAEALGRGLQDFLSHEGEKVPGKVAVFGGEAPSVRRQTYHNEQGGERRKAGDAGSYGSSSSLKCFKCGKPGHKAADCWQGGAGKQAEGNGSSKIICFICGVEGHKATTCPEKKGAQEGANVKKIHHVKLVQQVRLVEGGVEDTIIQGRVNGRGASLVLDSGAHITVVTEEMVEEELRTDEWVVLKGFNESRMVPTANVKFEIDGMDEWEETVALAPAEKMKEVEVIYGLRLRTPRGQALLALALEQEGIEIGVKKVTTRADSKKEEAERQENAKLVEAERPSAKTVLTEGREKVEAGVKPVEEPNPSSVSQEVPVVTETRKEVEAGLEPVEEPSPSSGRQEVSVSKGSTGDGKLVADRPASNPEPVSLVTKVDPEESGVSLQDEMEDCCLRKDGGLVYLVVPPAKEGPGDRAELVEEVRRNPKLKGCRSVAERHSSLAVVTEAVKVLERKPVAVRAGAVKTVRRTVKAAKPRGQRRVAGIKPSSLSIGVVGERGPGRGGTVVDKPARKPQTAPQVAATTRQDSTVVVESGKEDEWPDWAGMTNTEEGETGMVIQGQGELQGEVEHCLKEGGEVEDSEGLTVAGALVCQDKMSLYKVGEQVDKASTPIGKEEAECCESGDSGDTKQLTDELVSITSEAKGRPSSLGEGAMEPGISAMTGGEDDREAEWVSGKLARVAEEEPKAKKMIGLAEKQMVKIVTGGDHAKDVEAVDKVGRAAEAVTEERGGRSDTASGKSVCNLQPQSGVVDGVVDVPNRQKEVAAVWQKVRLKPVRALDVILRASALEQARLEKFGLDGRAEVNEKSKFEGSEGTSGEARVEDLGGMKDDDIMELREESLCVELREESLSGREKGFDREPTVLSSLSSVPIPCVVCWTVEGLEAFARLEVSWVDVHLHTIPTQNWDSRGGDPKHRAVDNLREGTLDTGQQKSGGDVKTRFGDSRQQEARGVPTSFGDSRQLVAGEGASQRCGAPWMQHEEGDEEEPGLRPAPSFFVGGDVGTEPHRSNNRSAGVATTGVALQGPAEGAQQDAGKRVATIGVALKEEVCKMQAPAGICEHLQEHEIRRMT